MAAPRRTPEQIAEERRRRSWAIALEGVFRERGWDQYEAAEHTGKSQQTISKWLQGRYPHDPDLVFSLEAKLQLAPGHLSSTLGYIPSGGSDAADALLNDPVFDGHDDLRESVLSVYRNVAAIAANRRRPPKA